jgi:hypothetical protein
MKKINFQDFILDLNQKLNGKQYKTKKWSNYPNSIFYYYKDDDEMQYEIAVWTNETTYGIFI